MKCRCLGALLHGATSLAWSHRAPTPFDQPTRIVVAEHG